MVDIPGRQDNETSRHIEFKENEDGTFNAGRRIGELDGNETSRRKIVAEKPVETPRRKLGIDEAVEKTKTETRRLLKLDKDGNKLN